MPYVISPGCLHFNLNQFLSSTRTETELQLLDGGKDLCLPFLCEALSSARRIIVADGDFEVVRRVAARWPDDDAVVAGCGEVSAPVGFFSP